MLAASKLAVAVLTDCLSIFDSLKLHAMSADVDIVNTVSCFVFIL